MFRSAFLVTLCSIIGISLGCQPEAAYQAPPPPKVNVVKPIVQTVPIFHEENGETEAVEQATVKARVSGILEEIKFNPDDIVAEGDELFRIEQKEYIAALQSAEADVSSAEAELVSAQAEIEVADARIAAVDAQIAAAEADFKRINELKNSNAVSTAEWDTSKAALGTAMAGKKGAVAGKSAAEAKVVNVEAKVEKTIADLEQAKLNLERTIVKAPISGRVDRLLVKRGNLVENGTELIQIVKNDPIWANFNLSERFILDLERYSKKAPEEKFDPSTVKVYMKRGGDLDFPFEGRLDYYDPRIDQDTGTLQMRGVFPNQPGGKLLTPGMFVRVRVQIGTYENALLIPERAIGRDVSGTYVFVVDKENKAARKPVVLGTKVGELIVIETGLKPGDNVIVDGIQRVRPGVEVDMEQAKVESNSTTDSEGLSKPNLSKEKDSG